MPYKTVISSLVFGALVLAATLFWTACPDAATLQRSAIPSTASSRETHRPAQPSSPPTFAHDIALIVYQHCATCHHTTASGALCGNAPFALVSYADLKRYASAVATATRTRAMPPWLPERGYGDFAENSRLSDAQIRLIGEWVRAGAPEGPASEVPPAPQFNDDWQLGKPDMVLDAQRAITVPASGPDVFWNFVFSPNLKTKKYVRAIEVRPGSDLNLIHHANVILDPAQSARSLEGKPGSGFPGMDLALKQNPFYLPSHFLFWKPGTPPWLEPDGLSWQLNPGTDLVLNAHFMPMGTAEEAKPSIGLYFTDKPPQIFPMLIELENDQALDIPAGDRDFVVSDDFRLPRDVDVLAVYPHAHYLGHLLEGYATLPNGQRKWLIRIPDWDPNWQGVYHYRKPVFLPAGTVVSMRYHYDNSAANPHNPHDPPQRVLGGNQSTDEMAHLWFQIVPRGEGDGRLEIQSALFQHRVEKFNGDFPSRINLAAIRLAQSDASGAVDLLEQAVRLDPKQEDARRALAIALDRVGRLHEAIDQFRAAVALQPDDNGARYGLARGLVRSGNLAEGLQNFQKVLEAEPRNTDLRIDFGELLMRQGKLPEALDQFNAALAINPAEEAAQHDRDEALKELQSK